jgi:NAD(P)-dependent dehydrogenase (short-subunit alcohol dehydrogenase family)
MSNQQVHSNKVAFITGGNRGLGFETARELGQKGVKVVIGARDPQKGEAAVKKLAGLGIEAKAIVFEVTKTADHVAAYDYFAKNFGRLDILVNNAGIMIDSTTPTEPASLLTLPIERLRETFEANFFAPVALTQKLVPLLKKSEGGRIVNLSSILASLTLHADPKSPIYTMKHFAYDSSKTALNAFTVSLAYDLRDTKIKVNSAHPGWVKTDMGGPNATLEVAEGGKTSAELALLPDTGPTGGFFHLGEALPW